MMTRKLGFFLILALSALPAGAAWLERDGGAPAAVEVLRSDLQSIRLRAEIGPLAAGVEATVAGEFTRLELAGESFAGATGEPRLPVIRRLVELPFGAEIELVVHAADPVEVALADAGFPTRLYPVQPPVPKLPGAREAAVFRYSPKAYAVAERRLPVARIVDEGVLRGHRLALVEIAPVAYAPEAGRLEILPWMEVELKLTGADPIETGRQDARYRHRSFDAIIADAAANGLAYRTFTYPPPAPVGYLVICGDSFVAGIQNWVAWKEQKGYDLTVVPTSIAGSTTTAIKSYIQTAYTTWDNPPAYVLFVGDTNVIPCFTGEASGSADDLAYTDLDGAGYWTPDVLLGRWPVRDAGDLTAILDKTLAFEQQSFPTLDWFKDSVWLASSDHSSMIEGTHEYCFAQHVDPEDAPNNTYHAVYERTGGSTTHFAANVNAGRGIVCYSGHGYGDGTGTASVHFVASNVRALTNANKYPHVMVFACGVNLFNQTESFGETWLVEPNKGSVTFWGTSESSYWDEDDCLQREIYRRMHVEDYDLCAAYFAGLMQVRVQYSSNAAYYFDIYNLMGDPAMDLAARIPMAVSIDAPSTIVPAPQNLPLTVTAGGLAAAGALVAVSIDGELAGAGWTDASGEAEIAVSPTQPGEAVVLVSGHNLIPGSETIQILASGCGSLSLDRERVSCSGTLAIQLFDADLAGNAPVTVSSTSDPAGITVDLAETTAGSGEFRGSVQTAESASTPGQIQVAGGDVLTVTYQDAACEGSPQTVTETAAVDCQGPAMSAITFVAVGTDSFTAEWTTDEPADGTLLYGVDPGNLISASDATIGTEHSVEVGGLEACTYYYAVAGGTDLAGNIAFEYHAGAYEGVQTLEGQIMLDENMDANPGWTTEGSWAWGHPTGGGGSYGSPDPTAGYTGQNVFGYNLNGDYTDNMPARNLTTPGFDCSQAAEVLLTFQGWLGVEQNSYDHARMQVSGNGGSTWTTLWENGGSSMDGGTWEAYEFDLTAVAAGQSDVRLRWVMGTTDSSMVYCGWNIDDVVVGYSGPCAEATPTPLPTWTPTPHVTATPTATPTVCTPTPEPTETPQALGVRIELATHVAHPNEPFWVRGYIDNDGAPLLNVPTFFLLQVGHAFYFWPSWACYDPPASEAIDYRELVVPTGGTSVQVIPEFTWPDTGAQSMSDLYFYGAMLDESMSAIMGEMAVEEWGFGP